MTEVTLFPDTISEFQGEYRWLSNFWTCKVNIDGIEYPSSEAAYQAAKTIDKEIKQNFATMRPGDSKRFARTLPLPEDWEARKAVVMYLIVMAKFLDNPDLADKLIATGDRYLEEGNTWNDRYWGICPPRSGNGQNVLGKILMEVRSNLRKLRGI